MTKGNIELFNFVSRIINVEHERKRETRKRGTERERERESQVFVFGMFQISRVGVGRVN